MKKFVVKTTKEFTYDHDGRIAKEVVTEESYETEVQTMLGGGGGTITTGTIKAKDIKSDSIYVKVTGDNPYTAKFEVPDVNATAKADTNGITTTVNGDLKLPKNTVSDIAHQVKAILDRDLSRGKPF